MKPKDLNERFIDILTDDKAQFLEGEEREEWIRRQNKQKSSKKPRTQKRARSTDLALLHYMRISY